MAARTPNTTGVCLCGCGGRTKQIAHTDPSKGHVKGAFCWFIAGHQPRPNMRRHGHSNAVNGQGSQAYRVYGSMVARCYNKNHVAYADYGGRGIVIADEWRGRGGFERFLAHVGDRPSRFHSIDRIDNAVGYQPGNVRWATAKEQSRNTRRTVNITRDGRTMCLAEWCDELGVTYMAVRHGMQQYNLSHADALERAVRHKATHDPLRRSPR